MLYLQPLSRDDQKRPGIYAITSENSGRVYVGSAQQMAARWKSHAGDLKGGRHINIDLQQDYNAGHRFAISVLVFVEEFAQLRAAEAEWAARYEAEGVRLYNAIRVRPDVSQVDRPTKPFPIRLSEEDRDILAQVAEQHQRTPSDLLRYLMRREARNLGIKPGNGGEE